MLAPLVLELTEVVEAVPPEVMVLASESGAMYFPKKKRINPGHLGGVREVICHALDIDTHNHNHNQTMANPHGSQKIGVAITIIPTIRRKRKREDKYTVRTMALKDLVLFELDNTAMSFLPKMKYVMAQNKCTMA